MTTTERPTLPADGQPYVAAVRELLWSLPAAERDELLDDLSAHLAELAAEDAGPLRERLGPPSSYASDFVASAGVEVPVAVSATERLRRVQVPAGVRRWWTEMRPAWLVLRPFLIVFAGAATMSKDRLFGDVGAFEIIVLAAIAVALIGLSQRLTGTWDRLATIAGVIALFVVVTSLSQGRQYIYVNDGGAYGPSGVLTRGDGSPVSNIWAYDVDGNPIDVFLYDQNGRPLDDVGFDGYDDRTGSQLHSELRRGDNGAPIPNLYPRPQVRYDPSGRPLGTTDEPPVVGTPRVEGSTTTSTSTTSTTAPPTTTTAPAGPASTP